MILDACLLLVCCIDPKFLLKLLLQLLIIFIERRLLRNCCYLCGLGLQVRSHSLELQMEHFSVHNLHVCNSSGLVELGERFV